MPHQTKRESARARKEGQRERGREGEREREALLVQLVALLVALLDFTFLDTSVPRRRAEVVEQNLTKNIMDDQEHQKYQC